MVFPESIAEILGIGRLVGSLRELDSAVSRGLPKLSLERLSARIHKDPRKAHALKFEVVPRTTWNRRTSRLSVQESQRTERFARILTSAEYVLDDREQARQWLTKCHPELDGEMPLRGARSELGARRVEALLDKLFFGIPL